MKGIRTVYCYHLLVVHMIIMRRHICLAVGQERSPVRTQQQELCTSLCHRLLIILSGLNELVQTLVAAGPNTDGLLKVS